MGFLSFWGPRRCRLVHASHASRARYSPGLPGKPISPGYSGHGEMTARAVHPSGPCQTLMSLPHNGPGLRHYGLTRPWLPPTSSLHT